MESEKITFGEHEKLGKLLKTIGKKLMFESVRIHNEQKTKALGRRKTIRYTKSIKALSELKDNLEEIMFKDYPDKAKTKIYYGAD